jgi:hypothetical protein
MKKSKTKNKDYYINNKKFYEEISDYTKKFENLLDNTEVVLSDYLGNCFLKIAQKLATKPNFANYVFKDEMIADAVENCVRAAKNFDIEKSENPFSYFTQVTYFAFIRRIKKEKKELYIKFRLTEEEMLHNEPFNRKYIDDESDQNMREFMTKFEEKLNK